MGKISVLDCTLRDGGYINDWKFGKKNILDIFINLKESNVDIIECGFIRDVDYSEDSTVYPNASYVDFHIGDKDGRYFVAMIALGDIDIKKIEKRTAGGIDGIRLSFHKGDLLNEIKAAKILIEKGYDVFIQPVGIIAYSDSEILEMVEAVNRLHPYALYIVDTLGSMYPEDVRRILELYKEKLSTDIAIGFHPHNNLQLSFSNSQLMIEQAEGRDIIIDSSVFGMGRGAGNLPTELIVNYLNVKFGGHYRCEPLLDIMSNSLEKIYLTTPWGYSTHFFLSAKNGCHPNYSNYLITKRTLNYKAMSLILSRIPHDQRGIFDKGLIEKLYRDYQTRIIDDTSSYKIIEKIIRGRDIVLVGSGPTVYEDESLLLKLIGDDKCIIHINKIKKSYPADLLFVSNALAWEYSQNIIGQDQTIINTSNIDIGEGYRNSIVIDYNSLQSEYDIDNGGIMCIKMLIKLGIRKVFLAGFDGFANEEEHYSSMFSKSYNYYDKMERDHRVQRELNVLSSKIEFVFLTKSDYVSGLNV